MQELKKILLETMEVFHEFCEKNDLKYFLIGGTLLGAVRNKGFIPWDDDVDIAMPREDYNMLLSLASDFTPPLKLRAPELEKNFRMQHAKLTNEKLILEEDSFVPFQSGAWIDIFPLDYTFKSVFLQKAHVKAARQLVRVINLKYGYMNIKESSNGNIFIFAFLWIFRFFCKFFPRVFLNNLFYLVEIFPGKVLKRKDFYVNLYGFWGDKEIAPVDNILQGELYEFENNMFWGPSNAGFWLNKVYGDYMTPPPKEKQTSPHKIKIVASND